MENARFYNGNFERFYDEKLIICGNVVERFNYELPIKNGGSFSRVGRAGSLFTSDEQKDANRKKVVCRARSHIRRLANTNSDDLTKFFTLTFKKDIKSISIANHELKTFLLRLKYYTRKQLKYICVTEFQDETRGGVIHFHILCNLPYINSKKLASIWGNGFIRINKLDNVDNLGAYVTKYMSKDNADERLKGKKSYFCSRNLKKPCIISDSAVIDEIFDDLAKKNSIVRLRSNTFQSEYNGKVSYAQFVFEKYINPTIYKQSFANKIMRIFDKLGARLTKPLDGLQLSFGV